MMAYEVYSQEGMPPDTEIIAAEMWCPECGGPPTNERACVSYCSTHMPTTHGASDRLVTDTHYIFHGEAGGDDNRLTCAFIHRRGKES